MTKLAGLETHGMQSFGLALKNLRLHCRAAFANVVVGCAPVILAQ
jgi:hypothetical protein